VHALYGQIAADYGSSKRACHAPHNQACLTSTNPRLRRCPPQRLRMFDRMRQSLADRSRKPLDAQCAGEQERRIGAGRERGQFERQPDQLLDWNLIHVAASPVVAWVSEGNKALRHGGGPEESSHSFRRRDRPRQDAQNPLPNVLSRPLEPMALRDLLHQHIIANRTVGHQH